MTALPATLPAMRSPPPLSHTWAVSFHPARSRLSTRLRCSSPGAHFSSLMSTASLCGWAEPGDIYQYGKWLARVCVFARWPLFLFPSVPTAAGRRLQTQEQAFEANAPLVDHKKASRASRGRALKFTVGSPCPASAAKHNVGWVTTALTNCDLTCFGSLLIALHIQLQLNAVLGFAQIFGCASSLKNPLN